MFIRSFLAPLSLALAASSGFAQLPPAATWATHAANEYQIFPNITYLTANNYEDKLDVYERRGAATPQPTLIYIHGGGWVGGTKEAAQMAFMPYLEMGWNVVNVEYRLARVSLAPAAVEDCLCALRWVASHANEYHVDVSRLVVTGDSAGGHLALTTGMLPESAGLDRECPGAPLPKVAAIVNWYGITDVADLLDGPNRKSYAVAWLASFPNREEIARRVSPLTYVRPGLPPILTIHGDADPTVPYAHAVRLKEALDKVGDANQLLTIPGGKHGGFTPEERVRIFTTIREFLSKYNLPASDASSNTAWLPRETALGEEMLGNIERQGAEPTSDVHLNQYVNGIAHRLEKVALLPYAVRVVVLETDNVSAGALPGGIVFLTTGLLAKYSTEPELASVLAHEIGHLATRRPMLQRTENNTAAFFGCLRYQSSVLPSKLLGPARESENEADAVSRYVLRDAGYPASAI